MVDFINCQRFFTLSQKYICWKLWQARHVWVFRFEKALSFSSVKLKDNVTKALYNYVRWLYNDCVECIHLNHNEHTSVHLQHKNEAYVVFDASTNTPNVLSPNDCLMIRSTVLKDLFSILLTSQRCITKLNSSCFFPGQAMPAKARLNWKLILSREEEYYVFRWLLKRMIF